MSKNTKKLVPKLRFPEFRDAGQWAIKPLGEVSKISTGSSNREDSTTGSGAYTFFDRSQDIRTSNIYLFDGEAVIVAGEGQEFVPKYFVGKFDLHQRTYAIMDFQSCSGLYLFYYINQFRGYFLAQAVGSTVKSLRLPMFQEMPIGLPDRKEQQKIADCLSSIDDLINAQSQKVEALKTHKKGLMQQLFPREGETVPRLRFPEFRDAGEWVIGVFDNAVNIIDGDRGVNYPKAEEFSSNGFCVFLNAKNVTKNGFAFDEVQFISQVKDGALKKGKLKRSDVILTTRGSVGHFAIFSEDIPYDHMRINSGMVILRPDSNLVSSKYLYSFCKSEIMSSTIEDVSYGNAQQQLTVAGIKKLPLYYPKPEEQQKIADCLSSIDDLISSQTQKLESLKTHKKGLMQQLFPSTEANSE